MVWSEHTTKAFDSDLQELARTMAEMGGLAENQIAEAIEALTTDRARLAGHQHGYDNRQHAARHRRKGR